MRDNLKTINLKAGGSTKIMKIKMFLMENGKTIYNMVNSN